MKKVVLISNFIFCILQIAFSQKQANVWYFGNHAGLSFNSGSPTFIPGGQTYISMGHCEGTSSICDSSGSLLCYTNGEKIWNKNHQIMPNGDSLLGHFSSTSCLIVPQPGSDNLFYLFTTDSWAYNDLVNGFRYSIIDMCLDNGLGDIIPGEKNIKLLDTVSEKLAVIKHSNGTDYWVVTHKYYSDKFYAYQLSSSGIIDTVITPIGSVHEDNCGIGPMTRAALGQMKASPDGSKLALACLNTCDNLKELFSFDNVTGIVSNFIDLETAQDTFGGYGVSFSPDNSKLYISSNSPGKIYQFNLNAGGGDPDSIRSSKMLVVNIPSPILGLQLGPDGKIYVARTLTGYLGVINNPDSAGFNCNFTDSAISLNGFDCSYGMPHTIDSYNFHNKLVQCVLPISNFSSSTSLCPGSCTDFLNLSANASAYQWIFPGATPGSSSAINPSNICYQSPGNYDVQLISSNSIGSDTLLLTNYITVYQFPPPQNITQANDTLFALAGSSTYQWYFNGTIINGATNYFYVVTQSGNYNVVATDTNECEVEAVINNVIASINQRAVGNLQLAIFPDPVSETLYVNSYRLSGTAVEISIYNTLGEQIKVAVNKNKLTVDCTNLLPGLYFIEIKSGNETCRSRFMKQ